VERGQRGVKKAQNRPSIGTGPTHPRPRAHWPHAGPINLAAVLKKSAACNTAILGTQITAMPFSVINEILEYCKSIYFDNQSEQ